jgi:hypothetical protein
MKIGRLFPDLLASLGRELSGRLRVANRTIQQLEI